MAGNDQLEQMKADVRRVVEEIYNQGKLDVVDQLFAPNCTFHDPVGDVVRPRSSQGLQGFKDDIAAIRVAVPDINYQIDALTAENNTVVTRWTAQGTHNGDVLGIRATQKKLKITGMTACEFEQRKITNHFAQSDLLAVMANLGISAGPGSR